MHILKFEAENIKKLKVVQITPAGNIVQITGANAQGKTSVLDAIYYALAGTKDIPTQPVRKGAGRGHVTLDLGEFIVTRRFTEGGGTSLTVEAASGARFPSPQKMLDELLGKLTFDPLAFTRMDARKQLETLRGLVTLDVDIDALDVQNKLDYDTRTSVNRDLKSTVAQREAVVVPEDTPAQEIDEAELVEQLRTASDYNSDIDRRTGNRQRHMESIADCELEIQRLEEKLVLERERLENMRARQEQWPELPEKRDTTQLAAQIEAAHLANRNVAKRKQRDELDAKVRQLEAAAVKFTARIEARTQQKVAAIAAAKMPLAGLSFGEGEVIYNGLPLVQASDAEQLRISIAIAMAANPKLRVLRIRDGSLLDENSMGIVAEMAATNDYQVWLERVDTSGKVGVVMEDGMVKGTSVPAASAKAGKQK